MHGQPINHCLAAGLYLLSMVPRLQTVMFSVSKCLQWHFHLVDTNRHSSRTISVGQSCTVETRYTNLYCNCNLFSSSPPTFPFPLPFAFPFPFLPQSPMGQIAPYRSKIWKQFLQLGNNGSVRRTAQCSMWLLERWTTWEDVTTLCVKKRVNFETVYGYNSKLYTVSNLTRFRRHSV